MDLEHRVKALEEELDILKNQIQATLFEIQEQILSNAYPELRAEGTPDSGRRPAPSITDQKRQTPSVEMPAVRIDGTMPQAAMLLPHSDPNHDNGNSYPPEQMQFSGVRSFTFDENEEEQYYEQPQPVKVNRRNPENGYHNQYPAPPAQQNNPRRPQGQPPRNTAAQKKSPATNKHAPAPEPDQMETEITADDITGKGVSWTTLAELEGWASREVARIGATRTRELIKDFAHEGYFSRKIRDTLLDLVTTYEEILAERSANEVVDNLPSAAHAPYEADIDATRPNRPDNLPAAAQQDGDPRLSTSEVAQAEGKSRTILRLIAGVTNAGMGIQRGNKRNG
jgi:hypothetical protein